MDNLKAITIDQDTFYYEYSGGNSTYVYHDDFEPMFFLRFRASVQQIRVGILAFHQGFNRGQSNGRQEKANEVRRVLEIGYNRV